MRVAIHQPNYLPWLGYFRKLAMCDVFVFFDNAQMPGGKSFVSRNAVKTAQGRTWLTVPVSGKGPGTRIADAEIVGDAWIVKHIRTLEIAYAGSPWIGLVGDLAATLELRRDSIADLNIDLIRTLAGMLGIANVKFLRATEMPLEAAGAASISEILNLTGATSYYTGSGEGSMRHLDVESFTARGIETRFVDGSFAEYPQQHGGFEPNLSAIDAILNCGPAKVAQLLGVDTARPA